MSKMRPSVSDGRSEFLPQSESAAPERVSGSIKIDYAFNVTGGVTPMVTLLPVIFWDILLESLAIV